MAELGIFGYSRSHLLNTVFPDYTLHGSTVHIYFVSALYPQITVPGTKEELNQYVFAE